MAKPSTTLFGRRFLASIREPAFSTSLPSLTTTITGFRASQIASCTIPHLSSRRTVHTKRSSPDTTSPQGPNTKRSLTSGGLLLIGLTSTTCPSTQSVLVGSAAPTDSSPSNGSAHGSKLLQLGRQAWRRTLYTSTITQERIPSKRSFSSKQKPNENQHSAPSHNQTPHQTPKPSPTEPKEVKHDEEESLAAAMSKYLHMPTHLHMPKMPHRPTRDELLAAATGFWQRLRVRFKWASIRSMRPWNIDEWGAFVSWIFFGHLVWVLVGTTTFFSLLLLSLNTVFAQEKLAKRVGEFLTESAGVTIVFESAIVPKWNDGVISFSNVFVSRRPGQTKSSVSKGSSTTAAAAAAARDSGLPTGEAEDDGNYTQFDVTIATVNVTLSMLKWWNGKGVLQDVEVKGVRGVVDRTHVKWTDHTVDPLSLRHEHAPGDFEINSFKLEDLLVTVHQPNDFRPFSVSIFSAELPQLRKQMLFYDFLSATHMSGSFDGSLFTIHPRQVHGTVAGDNRDLQASIGELTAWKKFSRLRIDGLKIDHLNRGIEGPFGWINEGNVDIVADIMFPADADDGITKAVADFYDQLEEIVISNRLRLLQRDIADDPLTPLAQEMGHIARSTATEGGFVEVEQASTLASTAPSDEAQEEASDGEDRRYLVMDLRIHLNNVKAQVPFFKNQMSYVNQALVRPIVAYINAKKTYIPISCRIVKRASDFDGAWTVFDCGLMDDMSAETYEAFARDVENQQSRVRRLKKVGFWTLSLAVHALFMGMAGQVV